MNNLKLTTFAIASSALMLLSGCSDKTTSIMETQKDQYPHKYFVSYTAPLAGGGNVEGYMVIQFSRQVENISEIQQAAETIGASLTNLSGNVIFRAFTPLNSPK